MFAGHLVCFGGIGPFCYLIKRINLNEFLSQLTDIGAIAGYFQAYFAFSDLLVFNGGDKTTNAPFDFTFGHFISRVAS